MTDRRVSSAQFVRDQRAASAAEAVGRWCAGQPEEVASRDLAEMPAVKLVGRGLTVLVGRAELD